MSCASASRYAPVSRAAARSTSSTRRTCSRTAAWNAFLKTLEEPPPNTVFVLATTEAQKVPATVVDRCHRFDFHRPTVEQIAERGAPHGAGGVDRDPPGGRRGAWRARRPAASATPSARSSSSSPTAAARSSWRTCSRCSAWPTRALLERDRRRDRGRRCRGARCRRSRSAPSRAATPRSFASDLEARARELLVVQTLGEVPAELSLTAEADAAPDKPRPSASTTAPSSDYSSCWARRWRPCERARTRARSSSSRS